MQSERACGNRGRTDQSAWPVMRHINKPTAAAHVDKSQDRSWASRGGRDGEVVVEDAFIFSSTGSCFGADNNYNSPLRPTPKETKSQKLARRQRESVKTHHTSQRRRRQQPWDYGDNGICSTSDGNFYAPSKVALRNLQVYDAYGGRGGGRLDVCSRISPPRVRHSPHV